MNDEILPKNEAFYRDGWNAAIEAAAKIVDEWDHGGDAAVAFYARPRILERIKKLARK